MVARKRLPTVTVAEYARQHHVTKRAAQKWAQDGELVLRRGRVLVADSDRRLKARGLGRFAAPASSGNGGAAERASPPAGAQEWTFSEAKRRKEIELALKHRIAREIQEGRLVDRDVVRREQYDVARRVREAFLAWPGRVAAEMAADLGIDAGDLGAVLEVHVRTFLADQADGLS